MRMDAAATKEALIQRLPAVIESLYGERAQWNRTEWRLGDITGNPGGSLSIEGRDPARLGLWYDHNPSAEPSKGDILDLICGAVGTDFKGALEWASDFLGRPYASPELPTKLKSRSVTVPKTQAGKPLAEAHPRSLAAGRQALQRSPKALSYLKERGLLAATIEHFHLGLNSYDGELGSYKDALSYPLLDADGTPRKRWMRSRVPGLTQGGPPKATKDWASGHPETYWVNPMAGRSLLFVCEGAKDGWWLWQAIQGTPLAETLCIITSTHGSATPAAWESPEFWRPWKKVYLGQDADEAGDTIALSVQQLLRRDAYRVRVPEGYGKDWTDFFQKGQTATELEQLLKQATILDVAVQALDVPTLPEEVGLHAAQPVDVSSAYVNDHLYVPFRVLERQVERDTAADGTTVEHVLQRYRTLVLRSDGVVCTFDYLPAPRGTPKEDLVLALSDGTIISRAPIVDEARATFSLAGITRLRERRQQGRSALTMTPQEMLTQVHDHLKAAVILPYPEDYALLAYVVLTSYAQQIFDAVPLVLIVGSAGSGKTDLGRALASVGCNASIITGQTSAATAARVLDQLNGLAIFDDLEEIGSRSGDGDFSEFVQQLKVSYKKDTATKAWTNTKTMRVEKLDFYGVKVITNTQGADAILSTRMLRVYTRKLPKETLNNNRRPQPLSGKELQELRDNLHIWTMENVGAIAQQYRAHHASHTDRQEEITAPLRTLAALVDHPVLNAQLQAALDMKDREPAAELASTDLVREAIKSLIQQGYWDRLSIKQLMLEMRLMVGEDWGKRTTTEIPEWQEPRWVGRTLRAEQLVDPHVREDRPRLWGEQTRVVALESSFVAETMNDFDSRGIERAQLMKQPLEFCLPRPCAECPYASLCEMRPIKEKKTGRSERGHNA